MPVDVNKMMKTNYMESYVRSACRYSSLSARSCESGYAHTIAARMRADKIDSLMCRTMVYGKRVRRFESQLSIVDGRSSFSHVGLLC